MTELFIPKENYESSSFLYSTIESLDYDEIYSTFKNLLAHGTTPSELFDAVFEHYSLSKVGHVDDKVYEMFSELSPHCFAENMVKNVKITLYRGVADVAYVENGLSWTTNENVAKWFASRFKRHQATPVVAKIVVNSNACLGAAPFNNPEFEVIIHPEQLPEEIEVSEMNEVINVSFESYMKSLSSTNED